MPRKNPSRKSSRPSRKTPVKQLQGSTKQQTRKSRPSAKKSTRQAALPKTAPRRSWGHGSRKHTSVKQVNPQMSLVELQFIARSRGIPFGGLDREGLAKKINQYL